MDADDLSDIEREVLEAALYHHRHTPSDGDEGVWFAPIGVHIRQERGAPSDADIEQDVIDALAALADKGSLTKVGETRDGARFPLYKVTPSGAKLIEG